MARRATKGDEDSPRPRAATVKERSMANFAGLRSLTFAAQGAAATAFSTERSAAKFEGLRSLTVAARGSAANASIKEAAASNLRAPAESKSTYLEEARAKSLKHQRESPLPRPESE